MIISLLPRTFRVKHLCQGRRLVSQNLAVRHKVCHLEDSVFTIGGATFTIQLDDLDC